jgi:alcohol dehydrogenase class IV
VKPFRWQDGERRIVFRRGAGDEAWPGAELVTTARALLHIPAPVRASASAVHDVPHGPVPDAAAALMERVHGPRIVAWGGGRVIDVAKAVASARGLAVCAVPTTLSGAELTGGHRRAPGHEARPPVRPALVLADPVAMESADRGWLRLSAMNALAHAAEALVTDGASPVTTMAALRAAELLAEGLDEPGRPPGALALGALLAAYAMDSAGYSVHHVLSQTVVRTAGTDHAATNAAILPHTVGVLARLEDRAPMAELAAALGTTVEGLPGRIAALAGGPVRLRALGVPRDQLAAVAKAAAARPEIAAVRPPPGRAELLRVLESAW